MILVALCHSIGAEVMTPVYGATVHKGKNWIKLKFRSYDELLHNIEKEPKWAKSLLFQSYTLYVQHADLNLMEITDELLKNLPPQNMKIIIKINSVGFSQFKTRELDAMKHIGALFSLVSAVPRIDSDVIICKCFFPLAEYEASLNEIASYVVKDIIIRND